MPCSPQPPGRSSTTVSAGGSLDEHRLAFEDRSFGGPDFYKLYLTGMKKVVSSSLRWSQRILNSGTFNNDFFSHVKASFTSSISSKYVNVFRSSQEQKVQDERNPNLAKIRGWKVYLGCLDLKRAQHI